MDRRRFLQFSGLAALGLYCNRLDGLQMGSAASAAAPARKITILGAGVAGLAAGLELTKAERAWILAQAKKEHARLQGRSKFVPHQGLRERTRRLKGRDA